MVASKTAKKNASKASKPMPRKRAAKAKPRPQVNVAGEQPIMAALRAEHKHIASVMAIFAQQLEAVNSGELVDTHVMYETMDYMVFWPDRYHHPREDLVYNRVAEIDQNAADNVDSLQREHDKMALSARRLLADIVRWREGEITGDSVVKDGRVYIEKMYVHMNTEEKLVFPQIEGVLTLADWRELAAEDQLTSAADPVFGGRVDREFRNLARKLRRNLRHSVEKGAMIEWIGIEALLESMEVMSIALETAREATGDHLHSVWKDSTGILREAPLTGMIKCASNNTRLTVDWLGNVIEISKDTLSDLSRVNQERRARVRMLNQASQR
ncbi:MAG: hemerythrin-like domain-containing protein [Halioglobus sp.]|jgi:hemerythrin-like domain-containing protein